MKKTIFALSMMCGAAYADNPSPAVKAEAQKPADKVFVFGDFLWWKADVEGTDVAEKGTGPSSLSSLPYRFSFKNVEVEGEWNPGLRLGLGYQFSRFDSWDLSLVWTHFDTDSKHVHESVKKPHHEIRPTGINILGASATKLKAHWTLDTNLLDLEIGRNYYPTKKVSLRPHGGVRGAWFDFDSHQDYDGILRFYNSPNPVPPASAIITFPSSASREFDFKGIGIKAGIDGEWHFCNQWSLLGQIASSLLYGRYDIDQRLKGDYSDAFQDQLPLALPVDLKFDKDVWRVRVDIEAFLGLKWKIGFNHDRYAFSLAAGYELAQWFDLNAIPDIVDTYDTHSAFDQSGTKFVASNFYFNEFTQEGNISFQGLTVKACFDF